MKPLATLDFETYYDKEYTLRKLTTEEYVRDPRFKVHGVGVTIGEEKHWITDDIKAGLEALDLHERPVLMQHAHFDGLILWEHFGIQPKFILDTLSMARALGLPRLDLNSIAARYGMGAKMSERLEATEGIRDLDPAMLASLGEYCLHDCALTYFVFEAMKQEFSLMELRVIDCVVRMFTRPLLWVDGQMADVTADADNDRRGRVLADAGVTLEDIMSNENMAVLLRSYGVDPPTKVSQRTGKETLAMAKTDKEFVALLEHPTPEVSALVAARLGAKSTIIGSRATSLSGVATRAEKFRTPTHDTGWPVYLRYSGARQTHRLSGADKLNAQNFNRGGMLRKCIHAKPGYVLVPCDSSNIELRVNMRLACAWEVVEALRQKRDLYCEFASVRYGRAITKKDKDERQYGKICHLALGYGMGWAKFVETARLNKLIVTEDEARQTVDLYRNTFSGVPAFWNRARDALPYIRGGRGNVPVDPSGLIVTDAGRLIKPSGMPILYSNLRQQQGEQGMEWVFDGYDEETGRPQTKRVYGGKIVENIVQSVARDIICEQMVEIAQLYPVVLQVHDEVVCMVPKRQAEKCAEDMERIMSTAPKWLPDIPLAAEVDWSYRYGDCK